MKNNIFVLICLLVLSNSAQALDVPSAVSKTFHQKFPSVKKVKWAKENSNEFEAAFKMDGKELSVTFKETGEWIETETEIKLTELPMAVQAALKKNYPNTRIREAAKILRADNTTVYEAEVKIDKKLTDLLFDENGIALK